jgi:hypothetical protein
MIRVVLPHHLRTLAQINSEVKLEMRGDATINTLLTELEARYPMLAGTIRDHVTRKRRDFLRYFVAGEDWSLKPPDTVLPDSIQSGQEPFIVLGSIAGG